jgi:hypothetical protein
MLNRVPRSNVADVGEEPKALWAQVNRQAGFKESGLVLRIGIACASTLAQELDLCLGIATRSRTL